MTVAATWVFTVACARVVVRRAGLSGSSTVLDTAPWKSAYCALKTGG
jgi:hypothetical protein